MMDLEKFLEKNIIVFLDGKIQKNELGKKERPEEYGLYMIKDYLKELNSALEHDELSKAKRLFDELKDKYSKYPKNSPDRKKTYDLLERMYQKIQEYVEIKEGKIEVITEGSSKIFKEKEKPEVTQNITINTKYENINRSALPLKFYSSPTNMPSEDSDTAKEFEGQPSSAKKISDIDSGLSGLGKNKFDDKSKVTPDSSFQNFPTSPRKTNYEDIDVDLNDITDRLLYDFRKKFEEDEYEQNQKIEALRSEIYSKVTEEVYKIFDTEKNNITDMIEKMKKELLDQVYQKAKEIVTTKDNFDSKEYQKINPTVQASEIHESISQDFEVEDENSHASKALLGNQDLIDTQNEEDENKDFILVEKEREDTIQNPFSNNQLDNQELSNNKNSNKYSGEDLKIVYDQAVYKMFDSKYDEAASLLRKIIEQQPNNKAAMIRLQECIDNNPSLASEYNIAGDEIIDDMIKPEDEYVDTNINYDGHVDIDSEEKLIGDIEVSITSGNEKTKTKRNYSNDELQRMYEEGIYVMFQSNYEEAAKIFKDILRIRPQNKAAKIRLQECMEAMNNA